MPSELSNNPQLLTRFTAPLTVVVRMVMRMFMMIIMVSKMARVMVMMRMVKVVNFERSLIVFTVALH